MEATGKASEEIKPITLDDIRKVRDRLKSFSSKWAARLAAKMYPEKDIEVARESVYNIISGSSRSQEVRNDFILKSQELIIELEQAAINSRQTLTDIVNQ